MSSLVAHGSSLTSSKGSHSKGSGTLANSRPRCNLHLIREAAEAPRGAVPCPGAHKPANGRADSEPQILDSQSQDEPIRAPGPSVNIRGRRKSRERDLGWLGEVEQVVKDRNQDSTFSTGSLRLVSFRTGLEGKAPVTGEAPRGPRPLGGAPHCRSGLPWEAKPPGIGLGRGGASLSL